MEEAIGLDVSGFPLGIFEGVEYHSCQIALEPGDCILAFTDGVTEAMNEGGMQLRTKGVYTALQGGTRAPRMLVEQVAKAVKQFAGGRSQTDDIALVAFGRVG